jgi:hypothetical protein
MALSLAGCITTSMQGYADLQPPARPIQRIAAIAPPALISALSSEASRRGVTLEDANVILPPTRQYRQSLGRRTLFLAADASDQIIGADLLGPQADFDRLGYSAPHMGVRGDKDARRPTAR